MVVHSYDIKEINKYGIPTLVLTITFDNGIVREHQFMSDIGVSLKLREYGIENL